MKTGKPAAREIDNRRSHERTVQVSQGIAFRGGKGRASRLESSSPRANSLLYFRTSRCRARHARASIVAKPFLPRGPGSLLRGGPRPGKFLTKPRGFVTGNLVSPRGMCAPVLLSPRREMRDSRPL